LSITIQKVKGSIICHLNESHIQFICDKQGPSKDCNVTIGYLTKHFIYVQIQDKNI